MIQPWFNSVLVDVLTPPLKIKRESFSVRGTACSNKSDNFLALQELMVSIEQSVSFVMCPHVIYICAIMTNAEPLLYSQYVVK